MSNIQKVLLPPTKPDCCADCPLLGIFGNEDKFPAPEEVNALEAVLKEKGKDYVFQDGDIVVFRFNV